MAPSGGTDRPTWKRIREGELSWKIFRLRARAMAGIRSFFRERGFLEVDPPLAARWPNLDPNLWPVTVADPSGRKSVRYLHTSPELSMKKLLSAGSGNLFFLGKVFRDREGSPLHSPEFTMLEWYRTGQGPEALRKDVEELCRAVAREVTGTEEARRGGTTVDLRGPWPRKELSGIFRELLGAEMDDAPALRDALARLGHRPGAQEGWEDLFFRALLDVVEPALAKLGAVFVTGFPAPLAAMAKRRTGNEGVSERFEGYVAGVELVNGYEELTDPVEQESRLRELSMRHRDADGEPLPVDPEFLEALRGGLAPCSGAALGVDRLLMLLLGAGEVSDVIYR